MEEQLGFTGLALSHTMLDNLGQGQSCYQNYLLICAKS